MNKTQSSHQYFADQNEDTRICMIASMQGPGGVETARKHGQILADNALKALSEGNDEAALYHAKRAAEFNAKFFGETHPVTTASRRHCLMLVIRSEQGH